MRSRNINGVHKYFVVVVLLLFFSKACLFVLWLSNISAMCKVYVRNGADHRLSTSVRKHPV